MYTEDRVIDIEIINNPLLNEKIVRNTINCDEPKTNKIAIPVQLAIKDLILLFNGTFTTNGAKAR